MKKMIIMILLSVTVLCGAGCSAKKGMDAAEVATASKVTEVSPGETEETGKADPSKENESLSSGEIRASEEVQEPSAEPQPALQEVRTEQKQEKSAENRASEQKKQDVKQQNPQETDSSTEKKPSDSERKHADDPSEKTAQQPGQSAQQQPETQTKAQPEQQSPTEPQQKQEAKGYSPQNVVSLATAKTKAYGKITLTDNLSSLLAEGTITQEEYNEYYPYDGAGYYSVFVQTDLNRASTTSGKSLSSEDAIAQYIADMLGLESGPYFLIEYAGTYSTGGEDFYEFRCYRA